MKADIIAIGAIDASTQTFLTGELAAFGLEVAGICHIDTNTPLRPALQEAMRRSECIILCSGQAEADAKVLAKELGLAFVPHEECVRHYQDYATATNTTLPNDYGLLPQGAVPFFNERAPYAGFAVEKYGQLFLSLPVAIGELIPTVQECVLPFLTQKFHRTVASHTVGIFGLSEATVATRLNDLMAEESPTLTLLSQEGGEVFAHITVAATTADEADERCRSIISEIKDRLGAYVFGVDVSGLHEAVVRLLTEKQQKIATAESCTAGLLSGKLTQISGASSVFECGIAAYSKEIKRDVLGVPEEILETQGAVSADTAVAMATGVRRVGNSHLGVGITGEAGPTSGDGKPVGTVFVSLTDGHRVWVKELHAATGNRDTVRETATCYALDLVRRYLEAYPTVMAGGQLLEPATATSIPSADAVGRRRLLRSLFPWRGDRPAIWIGKLLVWLLLLATLGVGGWLLHTNIIDPAQNRDQYVSLELLYDQEYHASYDSADFPRGMLSRFYALYEKNPDIRGWVRIADTNVSYPVMQNNAHHYGQTDFSGQPSHYGVPYFDENVAVSSAASVNRSYIIHGNNTGDGQMFSHLLRYTDANFLLQHHTIEMNTLYATGMYEVFAVLYVDENDSTFDYRVVSFDSNEEFLDFTDELQARSLFVTSVTPQKDDTLLLLETDASQATQTEGIRLVIAARRLPLGADATGDLVISYNPNTVFPAAMLGSTTTGSTTTTTAYQSSDILPDIELPKEDLPITTTTLVIDGITTTVPSTQSTTTTQSAITTTTQTITVTTQTTTATTATTTSPSTTTSTTTSPSTTTSTTTSPSTTTSTTTSPSTTTSTTTTASTTASTTATTSPSQSANGVTETAFFRGIKVRIAGGAETTLQTKEDLQFAVACAVKTEMGAARSMQNSTEAQKAQAVASYTYMLYSYMNGGTFSISSRIDLTNANDKKIYDAVGEVLGIKMVDSAQTALSKMPLCAMYSSSSNGATASCQHVYTSALPYLQSVESIYETDEYIAKYSTSDKLTATYSITWTALKEKLNAFVAKETDNAVTAALFEEGETPLFTKTFDGEGGYVVDTNAYYVYEGKTIYLRGIDIRKAIGSGTLRSHSFTVDYDATTDIITLTTRGHGHGLGLSQYGAIGYANEAGWTWQQILTHYYSLDENGRYRLVWPVWE